MPIYTYEVITENGEGGETFEILQRMTDPPLDEHPETAQPVRRVFRPANIGGEWSETASKHRVSDENLARHGFTKYQRSGKGQYERRTGNLGPKQIAVD